MTNKFEKEDVNPVVINKKKMATLCVSHKAWCGRFAPQLLIPAVEKPLDHEDSNNSWVGPALGDGT